MAKRCDITGRGPTSGNNRSHSMRATRRKFNPNLIKIKLPDGSTAQISSKIYKKMRGFVK